MISKGVFMLYKSILTSQIKQFLSNYRKMFVTIIMSFPILTSTLTAAPLTQKQQSILELDLSQDETIQDWLSGFELEVSERHFARMIHLFDLSALESSFYSYQNQLVKKITQHQALTAKENKILKILNATVDNYLFNENAYEALPSEIKAQLSEGLSLEKRVLHVEEKAIATSFEGQKQASHTNIQLNSSGLIIPNQSLNHAQRKTQGSPAIIIGQRESYPPEATDFRSFNSAHFENRGGWPELHRRWQAMPLNEKLSFINFNFLDPRVQASLLLATEDVQNKKNSSYFMARYPLKNDLPFELYRNLVFELDGVEGHLSIEIKLGEPKPVVEMLQTLRHLSMQLGVQLNKNITNTQSREDYSLHVHLSDSKRKSFNKWDQFWIAYKNYVALKILSLNPKANSASISTHYQTILLNLPEGTTRNEVFLALYRKGLIRVIHSNHIEARELYDSPEVVIKELADLLKMDSTAAIDKLNAQSNDLLKKDSSLFAIIAERNPYLLMEFINDEKTEQHIEGLVKKAIQNHLDSDYHQGHLLHLFLIKEFLGFSIPTQLKAAEYIFESSSDVMLRKMTLELLVLPNWNKLSPDHPYFHALYEKNKKFFYNSIDEHFLKESVFSDHIEFKLFVLKKFITDVEKSPTEGLLKKLRTLSFRDLPSEIRKSKDLQELQMRANKLLKPYSHSELIRSYAKEVWPINKNKTRRCESLFQK